MYEDLIGSIYDYMIETDYNSIGMVLQSSDDRRRYKVKVVEKIKLRQDYDSFRELNVDDQAGIISSAIADISHEEVIFED